MNERITNYTFTTRRRRINYSACVRAHAAAERFS